MDTDAVVEAVVGAAYEVSIALGAGFPEKVYHRALIRELVSRGLVVRSLVAYPVDYITTEAQRTPCSLCLCGEDSSSN
ncbi:MAG: GxxExxY protein [Bryobacteraceae bacterium]|jgi:GxxExxY protein